MRSRSYKEKNLPDYLRLVVRYARGAGWSSSARLYDRGTGELVAHGNAFCSPRDNPCRKIGRAICVGRALKMYWEKIDGKAGGT